MAHTIKRDSPKGTYNRDLILLSIIVAVNLIAGLYLINWISLDFDGFFNLQTPKNLVNEGKYATYYNLDYQMFNPVITTGPAVLLPTALSFMLFGIDYIVARMVMLGFYILLLVALFLLVREFFGKGIATISTLAVGVLPTTFSMAINTLGEIPATLYLLLGFLALMNYEKQDRMYQWLVVSGVCFGLAYLSKQIFVIAIVPVLIYTVLTYKRASTLALSIAFAMTALSWELYQVLAIGVTDYILLKKSAPGYLTTQGASTNSASLALLVSKLQLIADTLSLNLLMLTAIILGLSLFTVYLAFDCYRKRSFVLLSYIAFIAASFAVWFLFIRIANFRHVYAYVLLTLPIFVYMIYWLYRSAIKTDLHSSVRRYCLMMAAALIAVTALYSTVQVMADTEESLQISHRMLQGQLEYIKEFRTAIPPNVPIGYWGWWSAPEISFFVDNDFIDVSTIYSVAQTSDRNYLPDYFITDFYQVYLDPAFPALKPILATKTLPESGEEWVSLYEINDQGFTTTLPVWIANEAEIYVDMPENKEYNLTVELVSFYEPRTLEIFVNGMPVDKRSIPPEHTTINIQIPLDKGENQIAFKNLDGVRRPSDIPSLNNQDSRLLGLGFYKIYIG